MRVALDVTSLVGHRTGIGLAVAETVDALRALDAAPEVVPYALSLRARGHRASLPASTRFLPIPARLLLRAWGRADVPSVDRWLGDCDVVHATNYLAPPSKRPTVVSVYDCSFLHFPETVSGDVRRFEPAIRRAIRRGAWVHTGSEFVAGEIRDAFGRELHDPARVVVVPLGIPRAAEASTAALPVARPFVLAVGTLEPRKNFDRLVQAFAELAVAHAELALVLAGSDGPARPAVDAAVAALSPSVAPRVHLLGPVDDPTRTALLEAASVLAYPSRYEGFGFPVLEAMRAGIPVVAAAAGSVPEVAGDAAFLVDPLDVHAIATGLATALDDVAERDRLVTAGRARAGTFTWAATARGLVDLYARAGS
ncbi:MAG: glycosyltransferase family 1 protein [Acidimicrobiia bacterium]